MKGPDRSDLPREEATLLAESWSHLAGTGAEARAVGEELLDRWSEEHRRYHTLSHLWSALCAVEVLREEAHDVDAVRYAVWFHDAVYEGRPGQDEDESAALAERLLSLMGQDRSGSPRWCAWWGSPRTTGPVRGTPTARCSPTPTCPPWPPAPRSTWPTPGRSGPSTGTYPTRRSGRGGWGFCGPCWRPNIFHTPFGRTHWEPRARSNMLAEIDHLSRGGTEAPPPP